MVLERCWIRVGQVVGSCNKFSLCPKGTLQDCNAPLHASSSTLTRAPRKGFVTRCHEQQGFVPTGLPMPKWSVGADLGRWVGRNSTYPPSWASWVIPTGYRTIDWVDWVAMWVLTDQLLSATVCPPMSIFDGYKTLVTRGDPKWPYLSCSFDL